MPNDTRLQIIENCVFASTESLKELKEKVCLNSSNSNPRFCIYDNKFILEKTSPNKENFDKLVLSVRNIEIVEIPNFIEIIENYTFSKCYDIKKK